MTNFKLTIVRPDTREIIAVRHGTAAHAGEGTVEAVPTVPDRLYQHDAISMQAKGPDGQPITVEFDAVPMTH